VTFKTRSKSDSIFLRSIELRVFGQSFLVGLRLADPAFVRQHFVLVETQELIHAGGYIGHAHLHPVLHDVFDVVEESKKLEMVRSKRLTMTAHCLRIGIFRDNIL